MWVRRMSKLTEAFSSVRYKKLVQHRLRSGCRTAERMRLDAEIEKDIMTSEKTIAVGW